MNRVVAILLASLVGALVLSVALGSVPLPLNRVLGALTFQSSQGDQLVVWQIRLPRALAVCAHVLSAGCWVATRPQRSPSSLLAGAPQALHT